jgi:uncharacterized protein YbaP (TraB family)
MTPTARRPIAAVLAALLAIWPLAPAIATAQPAESDPEGTLVEELVVSSDLGGPAMWKVSDGDTVVWVMGSPGALPRSVTWDSRRLEFRLKGATALILPPKVRARPVVMTAFFLTNQKAFQAATPMEAGLPGPLRERFERARTGLKIKPDRTAKWKAGVAGAILAGELRRPLKLNDDQPEGRILALARKARVKVVRAGAGIDPMPAVRSLLTLDAAGHRVCLEDALDEVEAGRGRIGSAARGWATGNVRAALTAERGFDRCLARLTTLSAISRRAMGDTTEAIARQMARPGKAVAVVELRQLLAQGGVLDQLKARGFRVETPASER